MMDISAIQVGFGDIREKVVNKPRKGHFEKAGVTKKILKEFRLEEDAHTVGQEIKADIFAAGDKIDATAISKGKGFQGVIKRHNQQEDLWPMVLNSIDMQVQWGFSDPQEHLKKEDARTYGKENTTIQNLESCKSNAENNLF